MATDTSMATDVPMTAVPMTDVPVAGSSILTSRRTLGLGLLAVLLGGALGPSGCVTDPDELCPAESDPCVISGTYDVDPFSFLDFGDRAVVLQGTLRIGSGSVSIQADSLRITSTGSILGTSTGAPGGSLAVFVRGDIAIEGTSGTAIDLRGAPGGALELTSTAGSVTSARPLLLTGQTAGPTGGEIEIDADGDVLLTGLVAAQAGLSTGTAGSLRVIAGRDVRLANADLQGGGGGPGTIDVSGGRNVRLGVLRVLGVGTGAAGGQVSASAGDSLWAEGAIEAQGWAAGGDGGFVDLIAGVQPDRIGRLEILAPVRVDAPGLQICGGSFSASGRTVLVAASIDADGDCGGAVDIGAFGPELRIEAAAIIDARSRSLGASNLFLQSRGTLAVAGTVLADGGGTAGGEGGLVQLLADGRLLLTGALSSNARNASSFAGSVELVGCEVETAATASLSADGAEGLIDLRAARSATLGGAFSAGAAIDVFRGSSAALPVLSGSFAPTANVLVDTGLAPCAAAGGCGLGGELALLLPPVWWIRKRRRQALGLRSRR